MVEFNNREGRDNRNSDLGNRWVYDLISHDCRRGGEVGRGGDSWVPSIEGDDDADMVAGMGRQLGLKRIRVCILTFNLLLCIPY